MNMVYLYIYSDLLVCLLVQIVISPKSSCMLFIRLMNLYFKVLLVYCEMTNIFYLFLVRVLLVVIRSSFIQNEGSTPV